jgi:hypothetical protein
MVRLGLPAAPCVAARLPSLACCCGRLRSPSLSSRCAQSRKKERIDRDAALTKDTESLFYHLSNLCDEEEKRRQRADGCTAAGDDEAAVAAAVEVSLYEAARRGDACDDGEAQRRASCHGDAPLLRCAVLGAAVPVLCWCWCWCWCYAGAVRLCAVRRCAVRWSVSKPTVIVCEKAHCDRV